MANEKAQQIRAFYKKLIVALIKHIFALYAEETHEGIFSNHNNTQKTAERTRGRGITIEGNL